MNLNLNGMVSMWKMRELVDKATNIVMNYTETEAKVGNTQQLEIIPYNTYNSEKPN